MLTTQEAAELLDVSPRRVVELIHSGQLVAEKRSGVWFVDGASVNERARTSNKKGGRPARGQGKHEVAFTFMNRQHEVADVVYDRRKQEFTLVGAMHDAKRAPVGLLRDGSMGLASFNLWWEGRGIPRTRLNLPQVLQDQQAEVPEELLYRNLGLSLSDQYWICPANAKLRWEEVNFFNNSFADVADAVHAPGLADDVGSAHPDNTSDGNLSKHWVVKRGRRILQKGGKYHNQEPYNELVASRLHARLLKRGQYVPYALGTRDGQAVSECADFLDDDEEYVPALYVLRVLDQVPTDNDYRHYVRCCKHLGAEGIERALAQMVVCDDIIANHDRHWRNFGLVRNVNTLECRPAPLFDSGSSLWCDRTTRQLRPHDASYASKLFDSSPARQLLHIEDFGWARPAALDGFVDEAIEVLSENEWMAERLPHLREMLQFRVDRMKDIIEWS